LKPKVASLKELKDTKTFKLQSSMSPKKLYLFSTNKKLKKYNTPHEVIVDFIPERETYYAKRLGYLKVHYDKTKKI
jgi:hypothetical protein